MQQLGDASSDPFAFSFANDLGALDSGFQDGGFTELSAALAAAQTTPSSFDNQWTNNALLESISDNSTAVSSPLSPGTPIKRPKIGSRFSRDVIRTLKTWLAAHQQHPYPKEDDMAILQERTGLNQAQLTNWFANARRRGKIQGFRPVSPQVRSALTSPVDIIPRPGTPAIRQDPRSKDPLQRWVDSPPEHEPADVGDIARAMASSTKKQSYFNAVNGVDYAYCDPWRSPYVSSASSAGTSRSSEKSAHLSSESQGSSKIRRSARRKRATRRRPLEPDAVIDPNMPYLCTFCTETFRTKYDWQRHEKSLHLPLEKWVCALHGPRAPQTESADLCCVFCGEVAPSDTHLEAHHYSMCQERDLDERTFHRKDHLVQHLRLVHNAKFEGWSMKAWMIPMPDIKSRCGFCSIEMSNWNERIEHLAEHFKIGATMAAWKGDWGFEESVTQLIENAVPPDFIEYERSTFVPMRASDPPWGSPPNGYELLKIECEFFIQNYLDTHGKLPTNDKIQLEACRIIFAADTSLDTELNPASMAYRDSWLRDLIMSSADLTWQARFGALRTAKDSRHSALTINGKDHLFEQCPMEAQLRASVSEQLTLGSPPDDKQLQTQMCEIVRRMEETSITPSDMFANWVVKGIYSGTEWLRGFKVRAGVPDTISFPDPVQSTHPQQVFEEWAQITQNPFSSLNFGNSVLSPHQQLSSFDNGDFIAPAKIPSGSIPFTAPGENGPVSLTSTTMYDMHGRPKNLLPDDTNFFRIFERDLKRWVSASMSPKNPNCHVPSDEEIQHQARWIVYNGDDSWNQTPADFTEWLWRFKKDVGISNEIDVIDPAELAKHG